MGEIIYVTDDGHEIRDEKEMVVAVFPDLSYGTDWDFWIIRDVQLKLSNPEYRKIRLFHHEYNAKLYINHMVKSAIELLTNLQEKNISRKINY